MSTTKILKKEQVDPIETRSVINARKPKPKPDLGMLIYNAEYKIQYDYLDLLAEEKTIVELSHKPCKINVIISSYKKDVYLKQCVKTLKFAINNSSLSVNITVVQIDEIPTLQTYAANNNMDYIFLNINDIGTRGTFSKSLAFDIGYLLTQDSEITLFQDCDVLVTEKFFSVLEQQYINDKLTWLQPFCNKCLLQVEYQDTVEILQDNILDTEMTVFLEAKNPYANKPHVERIFQYGTTTMGVCGGSILVTNELFDAIGGMDPEICYGYGIEDAMMWAKLICTQLVVNRINNVHQTFKQYPIKGHPLYQYHLYHNTMALSNQHYDVMVDMYYEFLRCRYVKKMEYIEMKEKSFAANKEALRNYNG